jgi:hypothetical protein
VKATRNKPEDVPHADDRKDGGGDPLTDLTALTTVRAVFRAGVQVR